MPEYVIVSSAAAPTEKKTQQTPQSLHNFFTERSQVASPSLEKKQPGICPFAR
jgi:hypothetical protein